MTGSVCEPRHHDAVVTSLAVAALSGMLADYCWPGALPWVAVSVLILVQVLFAVAFAVDDAHGDTTGRHC